MRIESLHIDRFGKLRDFDLTLEEGLTLIYGRNESGKSTVMAFLRAMLYGLNGKSASIEQNDRRRYMPWGEISMGGSLRLTDGKQHFEIIRVFGQTKKSDTCRVTELDSGEVLPLPAGEEPGKMLLGVEEGVFADTLFVSAAGSRPGGDGAALSEKIRNLIGTGEQDVDLTRVIERLHNAKNEIQPRTRGKGELNDVRAQLDQARAALLENGKTAVRVRELKQKVEKLSAGDKQNQALRLRMADQEGALRRLGDYRQQTAALDERIRTLDAGLQQEQQREEAGAGEKTMSGKALCLIWIALAVLTAVLSVALGLVVSNYLFAGLLATMGFCILYMRQKDKMELAPAGDTARVDELMRGLSAARREHAMYQAQIMQLEGQIAQMQKAIDREMAPNAAQDQEALVAARVELEGLLRGRESDETLRKRISVLEEREKRLLRRYEALDMAEEELKNAAKDRQSGFMPELTADMEKTLSRVTAGKYVRAAVSQSMELSLEPQSGAMQPWAYFSGGTVELMYLALRLSLVRLLEKHGGPLPMLMDDPFVLFDDERTRAGLQVLQENAAGRQMLLFTCHERTAELSSGARTVRMED